MDRKLKKLLGYINDYLKCDKDVVRHEGYVNENATGGNHYIFENLLHEELNKCYRKRKDVARNVVDAANQVVGTEEFSALENKNEILHVINLAKQIVNPQIVLNADQPDA